MFLASFVSCAFVFLCIWYCFVACIPIILFADIIPYIIIIMIIVLNMRSFQIWQFPQASFLQLSIFYVVELIRRRDPVTLEYWGSLPPSTRIYIISLTHLWGSRAIHRLSTVLMFIMTPFTEKKRQHSISFFLLG